MESLKENVNKPTTPFYQDVDGFRIPGVFSVETFKSALSYKPVPDDLFIVTYPKCGTTWVQNIVACIFRNGKPFSSFAEFVTGAPFLEMGGADAPKLMKRPGAIKVHLPFYMTPWSPEAKYIYIARNPKDCVVSFYHHTKNMSTYNFEGGEFDDYFELFIDGKVDHGDYFDSLLSWYEHRNDPNVLFITYEQLKKDTRMYVLKIAEFIDPKYKEMLEKDNEKILNDVINNTNIGFMRSHLTASMVELASLPPEMIQNHPDLPPVLKDLFTGKLAQIDPTKMNFFRKGVVGDWKNYLSPMQNARLEQKYRERTTGTDIPDLWRDCM